jgi:hypothetical protein
VYVCSVRLARDETEGRPPLVPSRLGGLCICTSQLRSLPANTALHLTEGFTACLLLFSAAFSFAILIDCAALTHSAALADYKSSVSGLLFSSESIS